MNTMPTSALAANRRYASSLIAGLQFGHAFHAHQTDEQETSGVLLA